MMNWNALSDHLRQRAPSLELRRDEPMSRHTTFRVGGPASLMALPKTVGEAKAVLKAAHDLKAELFFLGNGSNLLVSDRGTDRFVVKLSKLAVAALDRGLSGLEFAQGIPGSVGGGVYMNAGAYGGEISKIVSSVTALEPDGTVRELTNEECGFGYRKSIFSQSRLLVLQVCFAMEQRDRAEIKAMISPSADGRSSRWNIPAPGPPSSARPR